MYPGIERTAMKTKEVRSLLKIILPVRAHNVIDLARNVGEFKIILEAWKAFREPFPAKPAAAEAPAPAEAKSYLPPVANLYLHEVGDNWIGAIKAVREVTNMGLKEAKDLVDTVRLQNIDRLVGTFSGEALTRAVTTLNEAGCDCVLR
jgi:large subunit ribosomal protein L7/L12